MARYTGPIGKQARREGAAVDGSDKALKILQKKNYAPGEHGNKTMFGKKSEYSKQLREKQKAKRIFGILEKQFRRYYEKAAKQKEGVTGEEMLKILETRLDNVVYRAGFANTRRKARQMVTHGHFMIGDKRAKTPSMQVKVGDVIAPRQKSLSSDLFKDLGAQKDSSPKWLKVDLKNPKIEVVAMPDKDDTEQAIESQLIVEFYSK